MSKPTPVPVKGCPTPPAVHPPKTPQDGRRVRNRKAKAAPPDPIPAKPIRVRLGSLAPGSDDPCPPQTPSPQRFNPTTADPPDGFVRPVLMPNLRHRSQGQMASGLSAKGFRSLPGESGGGLRPPTPAGERPQMKRMDTDRIKREILMDALPPFLPAVPICVHPWPVSASPTQQTATYHVLARHFSRAKRESQGPHQKLRVRLGSLARSSIRTRSTQPPCRKPVKVIQKASLGGFVRTLLTSGRSEPSLLPAPIVKLSKIALHPIEWGTIRLPERESEAPSDLVESA